MVKFIKKFLEIRALKKLGANVVCTARHCGVTKVKRTPEIIISLTTHPARIGVVDRTIKTLLNQTYKPDRIILWLAREQFLGENISQTLKKLEKNGLEIMWYHDIKSYKKLIPTMRLFPEAIIITVDDDWYYHKNMLKILVEEHRKYPSDIICHEVTHPILGKDGRLRKNPDQDDYKGTASYFNKLIGAAGVLYPPNSLHKDVLNEMEFMECASTNDDIWFWAMAVRNMTKIRVPHNAVDLVAMTDAINQNKSSLAIINEEGNLYEKTCDMLLEKYPEIVSHLNSECENR